MNYSRQEKWFEPHTFKYPVHVIGCGATGSFVALQLVKMGVKDIHIYDFDIVEEHNIANQAFLAKHIGMKKVEAFADLIADSLENDQKVTIHDQRVTGEDSFSGIVFVLTDTMSSRKEIWENCLRYKEQVPLVIETRMSINCGRIYAINPLKYEQVKKYEKTFYADDEAEKSFCGSSLSIVPTAMEIASKAVWKIIKFHLGKPIAQEQLIDLEFNNLFAEEWK